MFKLGYNVIIIMVQANNKTIAAMSQVFLTSLINGGMN
jgi:hypothetical protein